MPCSSSAKAAAVRPALNGLGSLFLNASHNFFSAVDRAFSICALLIAGLGLGDGEGVACGWAKQTDANTNRRQAARGRCFFILGLLVLEDNFELAFANTEQSFYYYARLLSTRQHGSVRAADAVGIAQHFSAG